MARVQGSKTRVGLVITVVTSVTLAMSSLVALIGVAPAGAISATMSFATQPGGGTGGVAWGPQPKVTTNDLTDSTTTVTLAIKAGTGTAGATLTCTTNPVTMVNAVGAQFAGCKIDKAGTGYILTATSVPALNGPIDSAAFNITVGPAAKLGFTTQPGSATAAGALLSAQPVVAVQDAGGNTVTSGTNSTATIALALSGGTAGAILSCTGGLSQVASSGVATFAGCTVSLAGTGYIITATGGSPLLTPAVSASFSVGAFHLAFSTQPGGGATGGVIFPTQPVVQVRDAANAVVVASTATITLSITPFTPATGGPGTLTCSPATNDKAAVAGVATFTGCKIDVGGTGYRLTATSVPSYTAAISSPFTVVGPTAPPVRIFGTDAIDTSIEVSRREFPVTGSADAVVLARSDFFSDALAGGPLAANVGGPLLITPGAPLSSSLDTRVRLEIQRVLPTGDTVYILGGPLALAPGIDTTLVGLGFNVLRVQGANLYATAVAIAGQLGNPSTVFEATGLNFADALSAVPAAISAHGAILLTNGNHQAPETAAYLLAHPPTIRWAIGGPLAAAGADPTATPVFGTDLFDTSAAVAATFFPAPALYGIATGATFPDALGGGVFMATGGRLGPVLLVNPDIPLPPAINTYLLLLAAGTPGVVFGGPLAVSNGVVTLIAAAVG